MTKPQKKELKNARENGGIGMPRDLKNLKDGESYVGYLAVARATVGVTKSNKPYLDLILFDGETNITAKLWNYQSPEVPSGIVRVQGSCDTWNGNLQLVLQTLRPAIDGEEGLSFNDFKAVCPRDYRALINQLDGLIALITDAEYKRFLICVLNAHQEYFTAPAARGHHHAYVNGLLEHSVGTANKAYQLAEDPCNVSLLITGALLHDIGKIYTYDYTGVVIDMTHRGKLLGHIVLGMEMLYASAYDKGIPVISEPKLDLLGHIIASHHGKAEWGSALEPSFKEAILIHHADSMDAALWKVDKSITDAGDNEWVRSSVTKYDLLVKVV